jgi:copper homeostasis protein
MIVEVCTDSVTASCVAQLGGAYRIELCSGLSEGGVTPSAGLIGETRKAVDLKVYVLIRPRGGDFLYNEWEFKVMREDVHRCGQLGCDGVAIGLLQRNGLIDKARCRELVETAHGYSMGVTFHRAFDRSNDLFRALEDVVDIGCERILTSGGHPTAEEGAQTLRELIELAGDRITVMPGSGVRLENAFELVRATGLKEIHGTFRCPQPSRMDYHNPLIKSKIEDNTWLPDVESIRTLSKL